MGSALQTVEAWTSRISSDGFKPTPEVRRDLPSLIETLDMACRPLDEHMFAVAFVQFMESAVTLGIVNAGHTKGETAAQMGVYRDALADIPGDLLVMAMRAIWRGWRYQTVPKPGDLRALVAERVSRRRKARSGARWAVRLSERFGLPVGLLAAPEAATAGPGRTLDPETQAALDAMRKRSKRGAQDNPLKPPPGTRETATGEMLVEPRPDLVRRWAAEMGEKVD